MMAHGSADANFGSHGDTETQSVEELNVLSGKVVDAAFHVHQALGPGLLESVYEAALAYELSKRGITAAVQVPVSVMYDGHDLGLGFRADMLVENTLILELKSVEQVQNVHKKQLLTYLRVMDKPLGLLLNFGAPLMKDGIFRVAHKMNATQTHGSTKQ